jgi:hypothetical protein
VIPASKHPRHRPSDYIRALVCHYPRRIRERRLLLMLRVYIDDSKQDDAPGTFVLAGYMADATTWADFSDEWQIALDGPPKLEYLKTNHMFRLRDPKSVFFGWSPEDRDARLLLLSKTTNKYALASIQSVVRSSDYREIFAGLTGNPDFDRPYSFLFYSIMGGIVSALERLGINDQVEFFFDEQGNESQERLRSGFDDFVSTAPQNLIDRIGAKPDFRDEKKVYPLQAADLMAWHFRRNIVEHDQGRDFESPVWTELLNAEQRITGLWEKPKLRFMAQLMMQRKLSLLPGSTMTLPDPSSFSWSGSQE